MTNSAQEDLDDAIYTFIYRILDLEGSESK